MFASLNLPSCSDIFHALTWRNIGRFFVSPLFAAFLFFCAGLYANSVLQVVADRQVVHCGEEVCPPLPDLGHELFPHLTFVSICDYWLYAVVAMTLIRFSPLIVSKSLSLVMLRRWLFLQALLFWMRGISVALTRQSVPQEDCVTTALGNAWVEGFYIMCGIHITCGDIMYSGHTAGITLCTLLWTHYSKGEEWRPCCGEDRPFINPNLDAVGDPATCSLTAVVAWVIAFGGFFFIIATHFHYSNDVFIGLILTQFVFRVYHSYIKTVLEQPGWWARLFRWFEGFDVSVLAQVAGKPKRVPAGDLRRGLLNYSRSPSFDEMHPSQIGDGDLAATAEQIAAHNADDRNKKQAVAPMAGIAVAVFSEGPEKASRDRQERENKEREEKSSGNGGTKVAASNGNASAPRHNGDASGAAHLRPFAHAAAGPAGNGVVTPTSVLGEYQYHALSDEQPRQPPVVVAGEITRQEQERKEDGK